MKTWFQSVKEANEWIRKDLPEPTKKLTRRQEEELYWKAGRIYADSAIREHLSRAAENATRFRDLEDESTHDLYDSIAETDIVLP